MKKIRSILIIVLAVVAAGMWCGVFVLRSQAQKTSYGEVTIVETADRTESAEHPAFVKEVFEPVIPDGENIAGEAKMTSSGNNDIYVANKANDGDTAGASYWEGASNEYPNILTATFAEEKSIHAVKVLLCPLSIWGARKQTFSVEISRDGENFEELLPSAEYGFDPDAGNELVLEFDAVTCKAVRLVFTANTGATGAQVAELELYSE